MKENMKRIIALVSIVLVTFVTLSALFYIVSEAEGDKTLINTQATYVCKDRGGLFSRGIGSAHCNDGTWQKYNGIELPRELWVNQQEY